MNYKKFSYLIVFLMIFSCIGNSFAYVLNTNYPTKEECNGAYRYWNDGVYYGIVTSNIDFSSVRYTVDNTLNMHCRDLDPNLADNTISYDGKISYNPGILLGKKYIDDEIKCFDFKNCYNSNLYYNITDGNQYLYLLAIDATGGSAQFSYARIDTTNAYYISLNYWDRGNIRNPHIDGVVKYNKTNEVLPGIITHGCIKTFDNCNGDFDIKI